MGSIPSKYDVVQQKIRERILCGELTGTLPGVKQLALEYDVNFMTVNKAINRLEEENLVYRIPRKGTYVRQQKNILFAYHDPDVNFMEAPFFAPVVGAIQKILAESNCFMIYENIYGKSDTALAALAKRIDGMIMIVGHEFLRPKQFYEKPCVRVLGMNMGEKRFDHITYENAAVGRLAAEYLLKKGHRRLAYIGYRKADIFRVRSDVFAETVERSGAECRLFREIPENFSQEFTIAQLDALMKEAEFPSGIFCGTDDEASLATGYFYEKGILPGRDVHLISCNNDPKLRSFLPEARPATFELCRKEIATEAARLLISRINGFSGPPVLRQYMPKLFEPQQKTERSS